MFKLGFVIVFVSKVFIHSQLLFLAFFVQMMSEHPDAWPFRDPVDARDVPDYYDVIKDPMGKNPKLMGCCI